MNLMEGLTNEILRVSEIQREYKEIPAGALTAALMEIDLREAKAALATLDILRMIPIYNKLKEWEL